MGKYLPIFLFVFGVGMAVVGGAKNGENMGDFPDTTWVFLIGAVIGTVGIVFWHEDRRIERVKANAQANPGAEGDPEALLRGLIAPLNAFGEGVDSMNVDEITEGVDSMLETYVLPFARVRNKLIERYGMEKGAEVLVVVAYGERMLNRVWSAAGDEHLPEARACFPEAREAFQEAVALLG